MTVNVDIVANESMSIVSTPPEGDKDAAPLIPAVYLLKTDVLPQPHKLFLLRFDQISTQTFKFD